MYLYSKTIDMSRGFVKEGDQEEAPFIPPRAALPPGVTNYVTPTGYAALRQEKEGLEDARKNRSGANDTERRRIAAVIDGKLALLNERIASARVIAPKTQVQDEIRFGASVKLLNTQTQKTQSFQIVGVDEADIKQGKIAFVAPIARAITGAKMDTIVDFKLGNDTRKLKIISIIYL